MEENKYFAFCFRSCIILVRAPPRSEQGGGGERGQTPPGFLRRQPHASIRKLESTPTPTGDVEILTPASSMGLTLFTNTSLRPPPPTSRYTWDTHSPHFSSYFPLISPTAAAALTSNGYWRPSRSFGGLTCPQLYPAPVGPRYLVLLGPLRPLPSWRPFRDCERTPCTHRTPTGPHAATPLVKPPPPTSELRPQFSGSACGRVRFALPENWGRNSLVGGGGFTRGVAA